MIESAYVHMLIETLNPDNCKLLSAESLSAKYNKLRLVIMEYNVYSNAQVIL